MADIYILSDPELGLIAIIILDEGWNSLTEKNTTCISASEQ